MPKSKGLSTRVSVNGPPTEAKGYESFRWKFKYKGQSKNIRVTTNELFVEGGLAQMRHLITGTERLGRNG